MNHAVATLRSDKQWVMAYGSNMNSARLVQRIGQPDALRKGYVEGFRLVFNKKAQKTQTAYANIAFSGDNVKCPAVAYRITSHQLNLLDQYEGTPDHYLRISLPFRAIDGNNTIVQAYIAHPDQLVEEQKPEPEYLEHIQKGYEEYGFDFDYLI
ncbi:gamma-glutamylcyclotransferase family protein [Desulfococcaceae bacterium HSG9]|nr:gamma-glutamylcyclotransferase family protein [Desulfococcaceae bacterium HSG9]